MHGNIVKPIAVIDLGTNTFNLLIATANGQAIQYLYRNRRAVLLGNGGINKNFITDDSLQRQRAYSVIIEFKRIISSYNVSNIIIVGTSALRTALNAHLLSDFVKDNLGVNIQIISGEEEATLIYYGIRQTVAHIDKPYLIVDIGGGSNELIVVKGNRMIYKNSYPIGMVRLLAKFMFSDPITTKEINCLTNYFDEILENYFNFIQTISIHTLIGAEGAFETFVNIAIKCFSDSSINYTYFNNGKAIAMPLNIFSNIHTKIIQSTIHERKQLLGIDSHRLEMIIPASIFINYLIEKHSIFQLYISPYSLKEGVAWKYFFG